MNLIILLTFLMFLFYYLASFNTLKLDHQWIFVFCFLISAIAIRYLINPNINKDYYGYFNLRIYDNPNNLVSFLLSEPYIYLIHEFFAIFSSDKVSIFKCIYWFNFLITTIFFIWLATRKDVLIWKKIVLFSFYYFLIGFVLLRNGPVYILYACFFYYSFRNKRFRKILFALFMHLSALPLMVILFHKNKYYLKVFLLTIIVIIPLITFFLVPILSNLISAEYTLTKIDTYTREVDNVSVFHKIHIVFVTFTILMSIWVYNKKALNPIFITTFVIYYIAFFINPILGFRFSPYILFAILLFNFDGNYNSRIERNISLASFLLFPYFLATLLNTHTF